MSEVPLHLKDWFGLINLPIWSDRVLFSSKVHGCLQEYQSVNVRIVSPPHLIEKDLGGRVTSLITTPPLLGPYSRTMLRVIWSSYWLGVFS